MVTSEDQVLLGQAIAALMRDNKSPEAIKALQKAIEINPKLAKAHQLLSMYYLGMQNMELARKHFTILKTLDSNLAQQLLNTALGPLLEKGGTFNNM